MTGIPVTNEQYSAVRAALEDVLATYGITNQSDGKLRYHASKILLYSNHHQLQSAFETKATTRDNALTLGAFREMARKMLSRYKLDGHGCCDNCGFIADEAAFDEVDKPSMRMTAGDTHTDIQCPDCGALAFPLDMQISGSVIDKIFHDKTLALSYHHADTFAKALIVDAPDHLPNNEYNELLSKARLYYLDLLYQVKMYNDRRNANELFIKGVNTFIATATSSSTNASPPQSLREIADTVKMAAGIKKADEMMDFVIDAAVVFFPERADEIISLFS